MRSLIGVLTLLIFTSSAAFGQQSRPPSPPPPESTLLEILRSDAPLYRKMEACRQLGLVGTQKSFPVLAALMGDEKLSHMARYALEQIPDPSVPSVLRQTIPKLKGKLLAGALMSLGTRPGPSGAEQILAHYLGDSDTDVATAAGYSLARLGTPAAGKAIEHALANASESLKPALWDDALRCANRLAAQGHRQDAAGMFDRLRKSNAPLQIRVGAARGAVMVRQNAGIPLLVQLLQETEPAMFNLGLALSQEVPGAEATSAVISTLPKLPARKRALVIQALGNRGDSTALPQIRAAAKQGEPAVRVAAIQAIARLGDVSSLPILLDAAAASDATIASEAATAIVRLPGKAVDEGLIPLVGGSNQERSLMAVGILSRRRMPSAKPVLFKAAKEGQPAVRVAALKALEEISGEGDTDAILALLMSAPSSSEQDAAERTLTRICTAAPDRTACANRLVDAFASAMPAQKSSILRVLEAVGGPRALQTARNALRDPDAEVQQAAVRTLSNWSTVEAAPDLIDLARNAAAPSDRVLALRGFLRLAGDEGVPADRRLAMCEQAQPLIQRDDEKRLLLSDLGAIPSPRAVAMIDPFIGSAGVNEEACSAAAAATAKLVGSSDASRPELKPQLAAVADTLQKARDNTKNSQLSSSLQALQARVAKLRS